VTIRPAALGASPVARLIGPKFAGGNSTGLRKLLLSVSFFDAGG
jgi:hypothetical protein